MTVLLRERSEIPQQHKWDAESVYPSREAWEAEIQYVEHKLPELAKFQGRLGEGPRTLLEWFEAAEDVMKRMGKILVYATLHYTVDTQDQQAAAMNDRARGLFSRAMAAAAFAEPEILAIGMGTLRQWMQQQPKLAIYEHYFDRLYRRKEHVRSPEVEELLSRVMDPFRTAASVHGILSDADLRFRPAKNSKGEELEVAQGTIGKLLADPDREVRRTAWESYCDAYLAFKNTTANCIAAGVKQNVFLACARKYNSALEAALYPNNVPVEVFHNLIEVYHRSLNIWHRYWRLRKKALQCDKLNAYDTRAPLTQAQPKVPFEQAVEWISEGLAPLGEEYVETMRRGVREERWVDVYPNQGKRMGAFSAGTPGTYPFILMSFSDDLFSLSTLAHELGHSMHSYYTWKTQPFVYARYSIFVAEVASNANQALVRDYLLKTHQDDPEFQIAVIEEAMANFHRYFFIMPALARFEHEIHERVWRGEPLTAESLIELMADLFAEGYGSEVELDEERVGITWAQFPTHLYANFYVYQYATGISGAHALAERVLAGETGAAESYIKFLKTGGSLYPLEALKRAGVDLTSPEPVEQAFGVLERYVKRLEELVGRSVNR